MQVLSRVCAYAVDPLAVIASNPCEGVKHLYENDRSEIIWQADDLKQLYASCAIEVVWAAELAAHTGLRLGDLIKLSWSHVSENAIMITTGKSKHKRTAIIPLYDDLRAVLDRIPKRATAILTNSLKRCWTENSFGTAFNRAKIKREDGRAGFAFSRFERNCGHQILSCRHPGTGSSQRSSHGKKRRFLRSSVAMSGVMPRRKI